MNFGAAILARWLDDGLSPFEASSLDPLTVANRPLVEHVVDALIAVGVRHFVLVVRRRRFARALEIARDDVRFDYVQVAPGAGPLAGLAAAVTRLPEWPVIVHAGDSLVLDGLAPALDRFEADNPDVLVLTAPAGSSARGSAPRPLGVQILDPDSIAVTAELAFRAEGELTLDELPEAIEERGGRVASEVVAQGWRFATTPESLLTLNERLLDRLPAQPERTDDLETVGRVVISPTARVRASTLRGPLIIGDYAVVQDSYLGPYTSIGSRAVVDGCEIERSILQEGAEIHSVGVRIEDSIIGPGARITRTFTRPNAMRVQLGPNGRVSIS